jgi:hypothetical protein
MINEGTILEFVSGNRYEVIKVWNQRLVDIKALQPLFKTMPDYFPIHLSIRLKHFKIVSSNEDTAERSGGN